MQESAGQPVGSRGPALLVTCAVAGLGALAVAQLGLVRQIWSSPETDEVITYTESAVLVLALLAWHMSPRRSWLVLVVLGASCTVPTQVLLLAQESFGPSARIPYLVLDSASRPLLLVGLLGVATVVWRAGRRGIAGALLGVAMLLPMLTLFVLLPTNGVGSFVPVLGLVLVAATAVVTVVTAMTDPRLTESAPRPRWRVTIAGAVAGLTPLVHRIWPTPEPAASGAHAYYEQAGPHFLVVGLAVLGIGLVVGAIAGPRVLVAGTATGLLHGATWSLAGLAVRDIDALPDGVSPIIALAALAAGGAIALSRAKAMIGVTVLGVLVLGLLVEWLVFVVNETRFDGKVFALLVVAVIAAVPVIATLGAMVSSAGAAPAVFAGVAAAVSAGVNKITAAVFYLAPGDKSAFNLYPPVMVALGVAAGLTMLVHRQVTRGPRRVRLDAAASGPGG